MSHKKVVAASLLISSTIIFGSSTFAITPYRYQSLPKKAFTAIIPEIVEIAPIYDKFDQNRYQKPILPRISQKTKVLAPKTHENAPKVQINGRKVYGVATHYCCTVHYGSSGPYAAAGSELRKALGSHWRGQWVRVVYNGHSIKVKLVDWCGCPGSRIIDLYKSQFVRLAPLWRGVIKVKVILGD